MSKVHRFEGDLSKQNFQWDGIEPLEINTDIVHGVMKHVLVGPEDGAPNFIIRYFNVPAGEKTFYDQHPHEHGIVILHGKAKVQINDDFYELEPLSSIFISGNDVHQLTNIGDGPLGFICVIKRQD
ncbi:MAG: cupin domain-containing protein [Anaerolineaceae bacterium]|jgi:quercetin dioxygenase-like cupin family protein|nr:cupin domain-containing protein [Anaerolineaceae bacterium]